MRYFKTNLGCYMSLLDGFTTNLTGLIEITEEEYNEAIAAIEAEAEAQASEEDYLAALGRLGVTEDE